jgi:hypothetical protein
MRARSLSGLLALALLLTPEAARAARLSTDETLSSFRLFPESQGLGTECKLCYDKQVGIFFFTYYHKFSGVASDLFANEESWEQRAPAYSLVSWINERTARFSGPSPDDASNAHPLPLLRGAHDDDEGGEWVAVGYKECFLCSCHPDESSGRCHEWHDRCGGESMEVAWLSAIAHAQRGDFEELRHLAARLPMRVRVDWSRHVATLLDCSGSGQVMLQDGIAESSATR